MMLPETENGTDIAPEAEAPGGSGDEDKWIVILDRNAVSAGGPEHWYDRFRVRLFRGIKEDFRSRLAVYRDDWRVGKVKDARHRGGKSDRPGLLKLLAPATYIFLASFIPGTMPVTFWSARTKENVKATKQ